MRGAGALSFMYHDRPVSSLVFRVAIVFEIQYCSRSADETSLARRAMGVTIVYWFQQEPQYLEELILSLGVRACLIDIEIKISRIPIGKPRTQGHC